ncbi:MAG: hypothetical protein F6K09_27295 [Merismopedia sp. SIO2A8]|nr:hypothetical protein [Merismopedia sp. SIO2A8]
MTFNAQHTGLYGLQASQIVYLEHDDHRLYVELIQIIQERQMGWLRPLCFRIPISQTVLDINHLNQTAYSDGRSYILYDMRQSADLLWSLSDCRTALDTDVIPLLSHLGPERTSLSDQGAARQILNQFIKKMWDGQCKDKPPS